MAENRRYGICSQIGAVVPDAARSEAIVLLYGRPALYEILVPLYGKGRGKQPVQSAENTRISRTGEGRRTEASVPGAAFLRIRYVPSAPLLIKAAMLKLIAYYVEHAASAVADVELAAVSEPLQGVIEHIHLNYHRNLTIDMLAERAHLHPNYFIRVFKRQFGTSPIQYVNRKRIEEAKWLLTSTNLLLAEIGAKVGIPDVSYLSKLFKSSTGLSPTAYRLTQHPNPSNSTI